jgi:hypothetical protein
VLKNVADLHIEFFNSHRVWYLSVGLLMMLSVSFPNPFPHLARINRHNVSGFKQAPLAELSGSLGDLGTLLPLMTAMVLTNSISLPSTLLFTGAANIVTGMAFGVPLPVQPMKAIAAVAIARKFSQEETAAAGLVVASLVGLFSITGLVNWANKMTPVPVVKGIQVGAGLSLCLSAGSSLLGTLSWTGPLWSDNLLWALAAALFLLTTLLFPRLPFAMIIFAIGIFFSLLSSTKDSPDIVSGPAVPILHPSPKDFWYATSTAALGQLPLTLLNSVIAVSALCADLLPSPPHPTSPGVTNIGLSVAVLNLFGCWFGAMPACHGSGGLAAQHRFGARTGASVIILGAAKMALGFVALAHPAPILSVFAGIPKALLGVLVLAAGVELAAVGESINSNSRDLRLLDNDGEWDGKSVMELGERERKERWMVMLVTVAALLAFRNDAVGFVAGMTWHWGCRVTKRLEEGRDARARLGGGWFARGRRSGSFGVGERTLLLRHEESDRVA